MNLSRDEVQRIVLDGLEMCNQARPDHEQIPVAPETQLFGHDGHLDSMGLVGLLLDIEDGLIEADLDIALSDERAMSQKHSPFRSVESLTDYIMERVGEL